MNKNPLKAASGLLALALALPMAPAPAFARRGHRTHEPPAAPARETAPLPTAPSVPAAPATSEGVATLRLSATLSPSDPQTVRSGVVWRVFQEAAQPDGSHKLVAQSSDSTPAFQLPDGAYVVHAAYGLAGATRRVVVEGRSVSERVPLNAGGLKLVDMLGDTRIPAQRLAISIYVPERGNSEAKLVLANAKGDEVIGLPEGAYHIVSTLLDTTQGGNNTTNSVVTADLKVPAGKLIEATLKHHAATMTLKLVKARGGEALANTSFSVLTPGGDVIRELIGAFPSMVLAEGNMSPSRDMRARPFKRPSVSSRRRTPTSKS